ncbi:MAG TPA: class I SAM-dependent methyltransferase [Polyangiales bacterium]
MGFYNDFVLPWCIDVSCGMKALRPERRRLASDLHGTVLEVGFGSGLNLPFMPTAVTRVLAVEPSEGARRLAAKRVDEATCKVEFAGLDAQRVQLDDAVADCALSTFTLCTIPDAERALAEVKRILKPGGRLYVIEHGAAPDAGVARWQARLNGFQRTIAGGCNLNRDIRALLERAGFRADKIDAGYFPQMPRTHGYLYAGSALSA